MLAARHIERRQKLGIEPTPFRIIGKGERMSLGKSLCAAAALVALVSAPVRAALEFGRTSDSLYIQGATPLGNQATIEAVVKLQLPPPGLDGRIFNELAGGYMDVDLGVDSSGLWGYMFPPSVGYAIANVPVIVIRLSSFCDVLHVVEQPRGRKTSRYP
jgi:hypothetical protein